MTTPTSSSTTPPASEMASKIPYYSTLLSSFTASKHTFQVLQSISNRPSIPKLPSPSPSSPRQTLHILDSSYNPPTLAHHQIVLTSLLSFQKSQTQTQSTNPDTRPPPRLLLLLATQNADKAPKPASFPERLIMLEIFANSLLSTLSQPLQNELVIDIGVTKYPYFVDKSLSIASSSSYSDLGGGELEQIHLIGYDTLTRLLSPKYYPGNTLKSLLPFLEKHRLEVTYRTDDKWGDKSSQDLFLRRLGEGRLFVLDGMAGEGESEMGSLEGYGGLRTWVTGGRIVMVGGRKEGEKVVSSTRVREAVKSGDRSALEGLVDRGVGEFIGVRGLYVDE